MYLSSLHYETPHVWFYPAHCLCFSSVLLAFWSRCLGKRELVFVLIVLLFVSYAHVNLCHFFSSSWCLGLAAASACGSSWTFLFTFLPRSKFSKSKKQYISWNSWNIVIKFWYWHYLAHGITKCHLSWSRLCRVPNSAEVKLALSLVACGIVWKMLHTRWYGQVLAHSFTNCYLS